MQDLFTLLLCQQEWSSLNDSSRRFTIANESHHAAPSRARQTLGFAWFPDTMCDSFHDLSLKGSAIAQPGESIV